MHRPLRRAGRRGLIASILATAIGAAPAASAEIFKCFAKDRTPVYQNFPCQFSSIDSVPSSPQAKMPALPVDAGRAKPKAVPVSVALPVQPAEPEPSLGMAPDEVRTVLGEPWRSSRIIRPKESTPGATSTGRSSSIVRSAW
jgi:hypothetical protein